MMRSNLAALIVLLTASAVVQGLSVHQAVVPALDAVGHVECAKAISEQGLLAVMRERDHPPLFPLLVLGTESLLAGAYSAVGPVPADIWAHSVQLAACLPLVLAIVPFYLILIRLFDLRVAVCGGALFCVMPSVSRLGADGLADSTHLLLFTCALWLAVCYFQSESQRFHWPWLLGCGVALGLAMFCRLEALVLLPALSLVCLVRRTGIARVAHPVALTAGFAVCLVPFVLLTGKVTPKHSLEFLAVARQAPTPQPRGKWLTRRLQLQDSQDPLVLTAKETTVTTRRFGYAAALGEFVRELPEAFGYLAGVLVLLGLRWQRHTRCGDYDLLAAIFCAEFVVTAIVFAARAGYMSDRHLLLLVIVSLGWAGVALVRGAEKLAAWRSQAAGRARTFRATCVLTALAVLFCLPLTFRPLHATRAPHLDAGRWLAQSAGQKDKVLDTRRLTSLYSGRMTYGYYAARTALLDPQLAFVVVEEQELQHDTPRSQTLRRLLSERGQLVSRFTRDERHTVLVYRWQAVAAPPQRTLTRKSPHA